jgi:hypothetical protein
MPKNKPSAMMDSRVITYFETAAAARKRMRRRSRNSRYSAIPSPALADTFSISIPGRTDWMLRFAVVSSNSTASTRSDFVITATSALLNTLRSKVHASASLTSSRTVGTQRQSQDILTSHGSSVQNQFLRMKRLIQGSPTLRARLARG